MAEKLPIASNDASQSFVELYHWCESWKLWKGHGKERRLVSWKSDGPEVTKNFEQQFRAEMRRLGEADAAKRFPSQAMRERQGSGFRNMRIMAEKVCYQLAIAHGELPEGWAACEQSGIPMPLPPGPLNTTDDLEQWVRFWLNRSKLTPAAQLHPASALRLWIVYSQAQLWFASHGLADDLPTVPAECDAAWDWIRGGQTKGEPPSQRVAEQALIELLTKVMPKASQPGSKATRKRSGKNSQARPTVANKSQTKPFYDPDLQILVATSNLDAHDQGSRKSSREIAQRMSPPKTAEDIKDGLKRLRNGGFVRSLSHGNCGGYWLTAKGRKKLPGVKAKRKVQ